jgi:SAM-dependent methyltransferase
MLQGAWIAKALSQQVISHLPGGNSLNYFLQRHVARSLPHIDATFLYHCEFAARYVAALREYTEIPVAKARCLEFGAGWDCANALGLCSLGVRNQILVDASAKLRFDLINETLDQAHRLADKVAERAPGANVFVLPDRVDNVSDLIAMGITHCLGDLMEIKWPSGFDLISSTSVMEHIPADALPRLVRHCRELLRPGGLFCAAIDVFHSPLHYQNRLLLSDHLKIIKEAGFAILEAEPNHIRKHPHVHPHLNFQNYAIDDLLCGGEVVVALR